MRCPFCNAIETKVIDSRLADEGAKIRRRRQCLDPLCGERFTTYEVVELALPRVVKRDGSRVSFNQEKLRAGMQRALEKLPVSTDALDEAVERILHILRTRGEREIPSRELGELVMDALRALNDVAYVRFASVYRSFGDVGAFEREIEQMRRDKSD